MRGHTDIASVVFLSDVAGQAGLLRLRPRDERVPQSAAGAELFFPVLRRLLGNERQPLFELADLLSHRVEEEQRSDHGKVLEKHDWHGQSGGGVRDTAGGESRGSLAVEGRAVRVVDAGMHQAVLTVLIARLCEVVVASSCPSKVRQQGFRRDTHSCR